MKTLASALAAATLGALALTGCGTEDVSPEAVAEAAKATTKAGTARMRTTIRVPNPEGDDLEMVSEGVAELNGLRSHMTADLSQVPGAGGELEILSKDLVVWMRSPDLDSELPEGKEWLKLDLQKASQAAGLDLEALLRAGGNPSKQLEYLRAIGDVEREGTEDVRGVETTRYSGVADLDDFVKLLPERERPAARRGIKKLLPGDESEVPLEVWIDKDDLVRRLSMTWVGGLDGKGADTEVIEEYYDFGVEVDVDPPPAEDVLDATRLATEGLGG